MDITEEWDEFVDEWDRRRRMAAQLVADLVYYYHISKHGNNVDRLIRPNNQNKDRERQRYEFINEIMTSEKSRDIIRVTCPTTPHEATSEAPNNSTSSSNSKKRKAKSLLYDEKLNEAVKEIAVAMKEGNEILKKRNDILKMSVERCQPHVYKEEEVYDELMRLGVDRETHIKGYSFLIENPTKARAFFGCPLEDRVQFLVFQMQSAGVI